MKNIVCITEKEYTKASQTFDAAEDLKFVPVSFEEDVLASVAKKQNACAVIIGVEPYKSSLYKSLQPFSCIARFGVGHDGVDKAKATAAKLLVTNTPGALDDSVAEHAIWLTGSLARQVSHHDFNMKSNLWQGSIGVELSGKTLIIIGCGKIGSKLAKIANFGFGMHVIGYDIINLDFTKLKFQGYSEFTTQLDYALSKADFVSLHMPSIPQTRRFINADFISKMKPSACLINTARGPIVDENALYDALSSGRLAGAGLDVFENEPYKPLDPARDLRKLPNIVLTPHVGSSTVEACNRMADCVIKNLRACAEKRWTDMDIVNKEVLGVIK